MTTTVEKSQRLARWLRHRPDAIGLALDRHGWADVADLLTKAAAAGMPITAAELAQLVADNDKQRFAFNDDQTRIRAVQRHPHSRGLATAGQDTAARALPQYSRPVSFLYPQARLVAGFPGTRCTCRQPRKRPKRWARAGASRSC
jgi:RNA:NAD 2'-phosphotransferase (TPT1/KptA family)